MKKIVTPLANGGAPFTNDLMETVFNGELWTAMESILKNISDPTATGDVGVIVSGCNVTANGGNWDCSSGIVYMNGQFMAFAGFTNLSLPRYIVPSALSYTDKVWNDGTSHHLISQQDAGVQSSAPGSGQYISLTTTGLYGLQGGRTLFKSPTDWTTMTLVNGWANGGSANPRWRINANGIFEMAGVINSNAKTSNIFCTSLPPMLFLAGGQLVKTIANITANTYAQVAILGTTGGTGNSTAQITGATATNVNYDIHTMFSVDTGN